mgnify:CR=1 FL=1
MSNHALKRRPLTTAVKQNRQVWRQPSTYAALVVGGAISASIPVFAASASGSGTTLSPNNTATTTFQQTMTSPAATNTSTPATSTITTSGSTSPASSVTSDVKAAALECGDTKNPQGLAAAQQAVLNQAVQDAVVTPKTDEIFNPQQSGNAATQGCFTASSQIINLATLIPTVPSISWGNIATMVQNVVNQQIQKVQEQMINRGCQIADQAILNAVKPLNAYITQIQNVNGMLNNSEALIGSYLSQQASDQIGKIDLSFNGVLDNLQSSVDSNVSNATSTYGNITGVEKITQAVSQYSTNGLMTNAQDANVSAQNLQLQQAQAYLNQVIANKPPQVGTAFGDSGLTYCKYLVPNQCTPITPSEYSEIQQQANDYRTRLQTANQWVQRAQTGVTTVTAVPSTGTSTGTATGTTTANPAITSQSTTNNTTTGQTAQDVLKQMQAQNSTNSTANQPAQNANDNSSNSQSNIGSTIANSISSLFK